MSNKFYKALEAIFEISGRLSGFLAFTRQIVTLLNIKVLFYYTVTTRGTYDFLNTYHRFIKKIENKVYKEL